jgi:MFS family permease
MTIPNTAISLLFRIIHETGDATMFFFLYYGLSKLFDLERMGGNTGIVTFVIIIGSSLSNLLFGVVGSKFGYNMPFLIGGSMSVLAFLFSLKFRHIIKN